MEKDAPVPRAVERTEHFADRSWADCIISMSGFDLRQAQVLVLRVIYFDHIAPLTPS